MQIENMIHAKKNNSMRKNQNKEAHGPHGLNEK